jgi:hypothetical protein
MRLFLDSLAMSSDAGSSGAAYRLLQRSGHRPTVEYLPMAGRAETLQRLTGCAHVPLLITDAGEAISGLQAILDWIQDDPARRPQT